MADTVYPQTMAVVIKLYAPTKCSLCALWILKVHCFELSVHQSMHHISAGAAGSVMVQYPVPVNYLTLKHPHVSYCCDY